MTRHIKDQSFSAGSSSAAFFIPDNPERVLVLAHGFPWPDESVSDSSLTEYARSVVKRWKPFAEIHSALVVAPVFGGQDFPRYREMAGRVISPAEFVNHVVHKVAREHLPRFAGRFSLHGHSAGAQFAARYLVTQPQLLDQVVLSAPATFPMPDAEIPWPYGMSPAAFQDVSEDRSGDVAPTPGATFVPEHAGWLAAASEVSVTVLVGRETLSRDRLRQDRRGRPGSNELMAGLKACAVTRRRV